MQMTSSYVVAFMNQVWEQTIILYLQHFDVFERGLDTNSLLVYAVLFSPQFYAILIVVYGIRPVLKWSILSPCT